MTKIERIEAVAVKGSRMTSKDKEFVSKLSTELGVEFTPRPGCNDCYADQAIVLRRILKDEAAAGEKTESAYVLREGVDVYFGGIRVNKDTLTDELAEDILERGFNRSWFVKCK